MLRYGLNLNLAIGMFVLVAEAVAAGVALIAENYEFALFFVFAFVVSSIFLIIARFARDAMSDAPSGNGQVDDE